MRVSCGSISPDEDLHSLTVTMLRPTFKTTLFLTTTPSYKFKISSTYINNLRNTIFLIQLISQKDTIFHNKYFKKISLKGNLSLNTNLYIIRFSSFFHIFIHSIHVMIIVHQSRVKVT